VYERGLADPGFSGEQHDRSRGARPPPRRRRLAAEGRALVRFAGRGADVAETFDFEAAEGFWRLVRRLPPRQAHVVALHYAADRSVAEIAEVLEVAEGTVKAHLHKARTRLTKLLAEEVER
jgi:RNA polymerase sigma-70 factor, ECF subfamily